MANFTVFRGHSVGGLGERWLEPAGGRPLAVRCGRLLGCDRGKTRLQWEAGSRGMAHGLGVGAQLRLAA